MLKAEYLISLINLPFHELYSVGHLDCFGNSQQHCTCDINFQIYSRGKEQP